MKILASAAAASALMALSSTAFAETLNYNFTMTIQSIEDGYGVFDGFSEGGQLNVSVQFDTNAPSGSSVLVNVEGLEILQTGNWGSSWSDVQYNDGYWDSYRGMNADSLKVNGVGIHSGTVNQEVYLTFGEVSSGDLNLTAGNLEIRVENSSFAKITAVFQGGSPTSVPELDPNSGMSALALLSGGLAVAWSRRRRDLGDASA